MLERLAVLFGKSFDKKDSTKPVSDKEVGSLVLVEGITVSEMKARVDTHIAGLDPEARKRLQGLVVELQHDREVCTELRIDYSVLQDSMYTPATVGAENSQLIAKLRIQHHAVE